MVKRSIWVGLVVLCLVLGLKAPAARSQAVYGSVFGTVTDPQGGGIAGATVTVTSTTKGTTQETTTNESGNYTVTHLIPDVYKVRIQAPGFKVFEVSNIQVSADSSAREDAELTVGDVTQTVEVSGEIEQLKTDRADVAISFNERYVEDLPILNRNFTNFELLSPGTQKLVGWSHAATENPQGGQQIFVNGQHFSGTAFELDGTDNQDPILGIIVVNPNLDAIQESKIAMQNYDAEFGKAVAGVVTVQTKSGTNQFHGSGFYDYRGNDQQARDPFTQSPTQPLPNASYKDFGVAVGGPVLKDKLFFFGDYQGTRQTTGLSQQMTLPTAEVLSTCNPATNATSATPGFCDLSQYLGNVKNGGQVFDPTSSAAPDGSGRTAFLNNMIPIGMISSQAAAVLAKFPTPQTSALTNNFVGSGSGPYTQNAMDVRMDYNAPRNYQVFGRFSLDYFSLSGKGALGALGGPGFGPGGLSGQSTVHNYSLATGFNKAIGTTLLTDFRFGYFKYNPKTAYSDASANPMTAFNIPGLNLGTTVTGGLSLFRPQVNGNTDTTQGLPEFGDGLDIGRCNCPLTESEQQFQFVNNWTKIKGNHQIKFGADIRYAMNLRVPSDSNRTGQLEFDSGNTSNAGAGGLTLATFLLGDVTGFERFVSSSLNAAERQKRWFFYGQDTWRVTNKFTFNYGLRWEIYFPESVNGKGNGGFANLDQGAIRVAGFGNIGQDGNINNTLKAFAPRIGFAYQFDPKTVVRMGYGRSFDIGVFGSNFGHVVTQNLPVLANQTISDSSNNPLATDHRSAVFNLAAGPPALTPVTIPSSGLLPLQGPQGIVDPRIRPTTQRLPTIDAWNATIQRQITPTMSLEVAYIGNKGTHVFAGSGPAYNANPAVIGSGTNLVTCPTPTTCGLAGFAASIPQSNRRRFFLNGVPAFTYPGYTVTRIVGGVPTQVPLTCCSTDLGNYFGNDATNNYEAIQVKLEKRFSQGLQFLGHYTYSHANAYDSNYYAADKKFAYGPDPFSRNNVFVVSTVYELPFGRGKKFMSDAGRAKDLLIGGWQLSNTVNWSGGLPWTPSIGECGNVSDAGPCRPDLLNSGSFKVGPQRVNGVLYEFVPVPALAYSLTPAQAGMDSCTFARPTSGTFALPACGQIGNLKFNSFRGPRAFFSDLSLSKSFTITERIKAQFRFDAFNVFNHPVLAFNSNQGNTCIDCTGNAGQITDIEGDSSPGSPTGMRQLQFGFRATF